MTYYIIAFTVFAILFVPISRAVIVQTKTNDPAAINLLTFIVVWTAVGGWVVLFIKFLTS
jgi:hypothetical protein